MNHKSEVTIQLSDRKGLSLTITPNIVHHSRLMLTTGFQVNRNKDGTGSLLWCLNIPIVDQRMVQSVKVATYLDERDRIKDIGRLVMCGYDYIEFFPISPLAHVN